MQTEFSMRRAYQTFQQTQQSVRATEPAARPPPFQLTIDPTELKTKLTKEFKFNKVLFGCTWNRPQPPPPPLVSFRAAQSAPRDNAPLQQLQTPQHMPQPPPSMSSSQAQTTVASAPPVLYLKSNSAPLSAFRTSAASKGPPSLNNGGQQPAARLGTPQSGYSSGEFATPAPIRIAQSSPKT
jgi:hypothetical protein